MEMIISDEKDQIKHIIEGVQFQIRNGKIWCFTPEKDENGMKWDHKVSIYNILPNYTVTID